MQAVRRALKKRLILCILLTLCLPLGGALLGIGLAAGQPGLWGTGIALLAVGFYGTPIGWTTSYLPARALARVVSAVTQEHLYTVGGIAAQLSMSEKEVRALLDTCFRRQYLTGLRREGDTLLLNENTPLGKEVLHAQCPACGARFSYTRESAFCPYCGTPVRPKK